jgi:hypothetical protein
VDFIERLRERGAGKERLVPWQLHDKLRCYEFCAMVGLPTPTLLRTFDDPAEIDLSGLPDEFVLKPTYESSSRGVMVLARSPEGYVERMRKKTLTPDQVRAGQQELFDASTKAVKRLMVEELVRESDGRPIPRDFKAYCFQGEVAFILELDRFDGAFEPLPAGWIHTNERYLQAKEHERPTDWTAMLNLARRASVAVPAPFVSIDMFASHRGPLIGEVTLVPGGFYFGEYFTPCPEADAAAGAMWERACERLGRSPRVSDPSNAPR